MALAKIILARYVKYMTAQHIDCVPKAETGCHIHNLSPEGKSLFSDTEDYASFLSFLEEYLLPPNPKNKTKEFTIDGKVYKGVTHMPKNYSGSISLLAYSLTPNRFDLLIKYSEKETLQRFMRSLSTRYSIYFHKKYPGTGSVFKDSYISKGVESDINILNLSKELHENSLFSSLPEYQGIRKTEWINTETVSNLYKNIKNGEYKDFVNPHPTKNIEDKIEEKIEKREIPETVITATPQEEEYVFIASRPGFREVFISGSIFLVLLTFGFKNISKTSASEFLANSQNGAVLSETTQVFSESSPTPKTKTSLREFAGIATGSLMPADVNAEPSTSSAVIAKVYKGNVFEISPVVENKEWFQIKLNDGSIGYILSKYIETYQNE